MSPDGPVTSSPDVGTPPERPPAPTRPARQRRPWLRWLLVAVGAVTLIVIALRVVAWVAIPIVLDRLAHSLGLDLQTRDVSLSLLGGEVELADVRAVARGGAPRVLEADYLRADLAVLPLLRGDVVLDRVEVEGFDLLLDRGLRDRVDIMRELDRVLQPVFGPPSTIEAPGAPEVEPPRTPRDRPVRLDLPVEVRRLVVRHLRVRVRDPLVSPPVDATLDLTVELHGLEASAARPTRVAITVEAPDVIERLTARGLARLGRERLEAQLRLEGEGIHPAPVRGWLEAVGVHIDHHTMTLDAEASVALRPALFDANDLAASFSLDRLEVTGNGERVLTVERAAVELERLLAPGFVCRRMEVSGVRGQVVRDANSIGVAGVTFTLPADDEQEDDEPAGPVVLREVLVRDVQALFQDVSVPGGLAVPVRVVEARLRGASSRRPDRPASVELSLSSPGVAREVVVRGDAWLFPPRQGLEATLEARGLTLGALRSVLVEAGLGPTLQDGELTAAVRVGVETPDDGRAEPLGWPLTLEAHVEQLRLVDRGQELLAIDLLDAPALRVDPERGHVLVEELTLRGPRLALRRDRQGALHAGGLVLADTPGAAPEPVREAAQEVAEEADESDLLRWRFQVLRLDVAGVQATWVDESPPGAGDGAPPTRLSLREAGALVQGLDVELTAPDAEAAAGSPARVHLWVEAPGVIERLEVNGTADAGRGQLSIALGLDGRGLTLDGLRPYLAQAGIEPTFGDGQLTAQLEVQATRAQDGRITGRGGLRSVRLVDGGTPLLVLSDLRADGATALVGTTAPEAFGVDRLSLRRLEVPVRLSADGAVTALGLRFGRAAATVDPDLEAGGWSVRFGAPLVPLPRLTIGGVDVERATVRIQDERRPDPERDLPVVLELAAGPLDFDPLEALPASATPIALRLEAPGAVDVMHLRGEVALAPDLVRVEALVTAHGLTERFVSSIPGLHTQDMLIEEGHARMRAAAVLYRVDDMLAGRAAIGAAALVDRTGELVGLDLARVDGFTVGPAGIRCADVEVLEPRVRVVREARGVRVAGWWFPTEGDGVDAPVVDDAAASGTAPSLPDLLPLLADQVRVTGLKVDWTDLVTTPLVRQPVEVDLVGHGLSTIAGTPPGVVRLVARAPGAIERLVLGGRAWTNGSAAAAGLALDARGIRGRGLAAYVPGLALEDGSARGTIEVEAREVAEGGLAARIDVRDLLARDGERVLAHVPLLALDAPRLDPARRIELARVVADVAELDVVQTDAGLTVGGVPLGGDDGVDAPAPADPAPTASIGAPPPSVTRPLVRVGLIDLNLATLRVVDGRDGRVLMVGRGLRLRSLGPFAVLGQPGRERRPPELELTGSVAPLVRSLRLRLAGDPVALEPRLDLELEASGLRGRGLTEVSPALAERLDGGGLVDGTLRLAAHVELRTRRSDPLDFSFVERGFGGRVELTGLDLIDEGSRLLAVDQVLVDVDRLVPGESRLDVRLAEVFRPRFAVARVPEGWRVAGLVLKSGPEEPEVEEEEEGPDVLVRQLTIMALDATFRDRTVTPPVVVPLRGLELEVVGFDLPAVQGRRAANRSMSFSLLTFSNTVEVPERPERGLGRLTGALSTIVGALGGPSRQRAFERVTLFEELSARGVVQPGPDPTGRVRLTVRGVELRGLIGYAARGGVDLSDGTAELDALVNLGAAGEADAQVGALFKDLSLTEPRNGPLQRLLQLPASLDALLFVLRDDRGRIRVSVDAEVPPDGQLERGEIAGAVLETLGEQFATALRTAPFRFLSPVISLINLLVPGDIMDWRERRAGEPVAVAFAPGSADLTPAARTALEGVAERLRDHDGLSLLLRHELGTDDEAALATITRPERQHDRDLVVRLERRRDELLARRSDLDALVRTSFAAGQYDAAQRAVADAQRLDAAIGRLEVTLFAAQDRLGSRLDRAAGQRARAAARLLADARLRAVREALCQAGAGAAAARRVRLAPGQYFASPGVVRGTVVATPQLQLVEEEETTDILEEGERIEGGTPELSVK